jgi:hypothetical protein
MGDNLDGLSIKATSDRLDWAEAPPRNEPLDEAVWQQVCVRAATDPGSWDRSQVLHVKFARSPPSLGAQMLLLRVLTAGFPL